MGGTTVFLNACSQCHCTHPISSFSQCNDSSPETLLLVCNDCFEDVEDNEEGEVERAVGLKKRRPDSSSGGVVGRRSVASRGIALDGVRAANKGSSAARENVRVRAEPEESGGAEAELSFLNGCSACKLTKRIGLFTKEQSGKVCDTCFDKVCSSPIPSIRAFVQICFQILHNTGPTNTGHAGRGISQRSAGFAGTEAGYGGIFRGHGGCFVLPKRVQELS
jgi:hypothetical protein